MVAFGVLTGINVGCVACGYFIFRSLRKLMKDFTLKMETLVARAEVTVTDQVGGVMSRVHRLGAALSDI